MYAAAAGSKKQRMAISKEIVHQLTSLDGRRFMRWKKVGSGGVWKVLSAAAARDKVTHALRHAHSAASRASAEQRLRPAAVSSEAEASARAVAVTPPPPSPPSPPSPLSSIAVLSPHLRDYEAPPLESPLVFDRPEFYTPASPVGQAPFDFEQNGTPPLNPESTDRMDYSSVGELMPLPLSWLRTAAWDLDNDVVAILHDLAHGDFFR